ncbi:hypothetical protein AUC43_18430 [Hymenobacter sedentarius]|uniref:histidine kinase n=1 Tax=Hymenobacter sedentarius TaxID=1411621 RepID=A0A0U4ATT5_9BACT|nr:PAS domain-containing protein [Hymenobacter sedentarius]ALW86880.1 hypothetical protein AUC43_18430 [Hymenobacter sedentarius]
MSPAPLDLLPVFNAQPGATLLLSPQWIIVGASDDYLVATLTERATLVGQYLFDAFPDNPNTPEANGVANVRASLLQVLATCQPHEMAPQHYDVPDPARPGRFVERHWLPRHTPVLDAAGQVQFILQSVQDVTASRRAEQQLHESQAAEQAARAEAEAQRQRFHEVLMQLPAYVAVYHGPDHHYQFVNPPYQGLFPGRSFAGRPFREGMPEAIGLGVVALFDRVYQTGEPYFAREMEGWFDFQGNGQPEQVFLNLYLHPLRNPQGAIDGVLDFSYGVTEQVRARQQLELLNQELETRVAARTQEAEAARAEAEEQRNRLLRLFNQAPAFINIFTGPEHVLTLVHPSTYELLQNRPLLGLPRRQALPELPEEQHAPFDEVYRTGQPRYVHERLSRLDLRNDGVLHDVYFDLTFQPLFDAAGHIEGVMSFAVNVTERVRIRQQAEALQEQVLAAAEAQARQRETFYQILADTPAAVGILRGPEHRYEYVNTALQQLFPDRQLTGRPVAEAQPETVATGFLTLLDGVYRTGDTYHGQEMLLPVEQPDGQPARDVYFTFTYQAYREDGRIAGVSIFANDVTAQVRARREREAQRQRLHDLFMQAPAAISILAGPELVFELVNPGFHAMFGGRDLLGKPLLAALPELAPHQAYRTIRRVLDTGETNEELGILVPVARPEDGVLEDRYFNYIQQARRDEHGRVDGVLVFAFEVTEQVQARQASEASARQLQLLTDALPVLISYIDRHQTYRFANQAYHGWFGLTPAEVVGRHPREVAGAAAYEQVRPNIERALAGERVEYEARMAYRPDFIRHVHAIFIPDGPAGAVAGFYTLVSDITEQVEARQAVERSARQAQAAAQELAAANQQLTRTNVDLDNFIYTASHDLKAPITNIEGLLDTLRHELPEPAPTGEVAHILNLMQGAVDRFKRTIDHLTEVSKLQKEHDPPTAQVALAPVLDDVRLDLAPLLRQTGGQLQVDVQHCPPLRFSEKNLRSVVFNLLSNALKYRHPERAPLVQVRTRLEEAFVVLEVEDNGLGLDLAREEQVFAMFQRLHTHVEGSGLGLYMVKRMVENAGGQITVHSRVGEGTAFAVWFPR